MLKIKFPFLCTAIVLILASCSSELRTAQVTSPSEMNEIYFELSESGTPTYYVLREGDTVIGRSSMGFEFKDAAPMQKGFRIVAAKTASEDDTWEMPWGEQRLVRNHYNELLIELEESANSKRGLHIRFRSYDDGIGFRYEFQPQEGVDSVVIMEEHTEFKLTGDHTSWWIPGDWDIYEHLYNTTKISEIDALSKQNHPNLAGTYIPLNAVNTPVTMRTDSGLHLSFHEAALTDYAGMTLKVDNESLSLTSGLVGSDRLSYKVKRELPFHTPWRTVQIAETAGELIDSKLILNLNEPNKLGDVSWFTPMKYVGIWWEMHLNSSSWDYGMTMNDDGKWVDTGQAHGRHGATTENTKRYIDFAAENGMKGVLVEGWNTGWERWIGFEDREGVFDFVTPYPDYDLSELSAYARDKGVEIIMHHET
ncbi:MAG: glycoside hydrolase family 97 N-terminal domain-containing protein, partial [Flavobacteriaceae bacterium]